MSENWETLYQWYKDNVTWINDDTLKSFVDDDRTEYLMKKKKLESWLHEKREE